MVIAMAVLMSYDGANSGGSGTAAKKRVEIVFRPQAPFITCDDEGRCYNEGDCYRSVYN